MPSTPSHLTQAVMAELVGLSQDMGEDIAQRSKARRVVADLLKALEEDNADTAARILENRTEQLTDIYPRAKTTLEKLRLDLNRRQEDQLRDTCNKLEEYCRAERVSLKGKSPKYTADHLLDLVCHAMRQGGSRGLPSYPNCLWTLIVCPTMPSRWQPVSWPIGAASQVG